SPPTSRDCAEDNPMQTIRVLLLTALALVASACNPPEQAAQPAAPAATESSPAEPAAQVAAPSADPVPAEQSGNTAEPVEESAGTEDATAGKDIVLASPAQAAPRPQTWRLREGAHFRTFTSAQGRS